MTIKYLRNVYQTYDAIEDTTKPVIIHYTPAGEGKAETPITSQLRDLDDAYGEIVDFFVAVSGCTIPPIDQDALPVTALYKGRNLVDIAGSEDDVIELMENAMGP